MSTSTLPTWHHLWDEAQPRLHSIQQSFTAQSSPNPKVIRVGQIDAELLDQELVQLLQEPLTKALSIVNSAFKGRYHAELTLLIQLTLYKFSVWDSGASYGARLQGLRYAVPAANNIIAGASGLSLRTLCLHGTLTVLVPYIHTRIRAHALSNAWPDAPSSDKRRKAWNLLTRMESTHGLLGLLNFIAFLWDGRYRTLSDRALNMRLVPARRLTKREVSYEFMNRQMVWHAFTEFLLFLLPLVNVRALRRRLSSIFSQVTLASILPGPVRSVIGMSTDEKAQSSARAHRGKYWSLPLDQCAICAEDASMNMNLADSSNVLTSLSNPSYSTSSSAEPPLESENVEEESPPYPIHTPYLSSCGHVYCYVCLTGRMIRAADDRTGVGPGGARWECLRCEEGISIIDRVEMEVEGADSEFGSTSINGIDFDEYGSEDMEFTDMSGSMGTYSDSGVSE